MGLSASYVFKETLKSKFMIEHPKSVTADLLILSQTLELCLADIVKCSAHDAANQLTPGVFSELGSPDSSVVAGRLKIFLELKIMKSLQGEGLTSK